MNEWMKEKRDKEKEEEGERKVKTELKRKKTRKYKGKDWMKEKRDKEKEEKGERENYWERRPSNRREDTVLNSFKMATSQLGFDFLKREIITRTQKRKVLLG